MPVFKTVLSAEQLAQPSLRASMRCVRWLVAAFIGTNLAALTINLVYAHSSGIVTEVTWTRTFILLGAGAVLLFFANGVGRGSFKSYLYVRIESAVLLVTVIVLVAIPGLLPGWMVVQQLVCGVLLLAITIVTSATPLRAAFQRRIRTA
jgi:hypothetical protein